MQAIILDTETHTLNGQPIEIAYAPVQIDAGKLSLDKTQIFDQLYSVDEPISLYMIGHNIDYDIRAIEKCGVDTSHIKAICTLALARLVWPDAEAHNISALIYMITNGSDKARSMIKKAHRADMDIILTANILMHEIHHLKIQTLEELYQASEDARIPRTINFGKHRGTAISALPADYMQWLLRQEDLDPYLRKAIETATLAKI